MNERLRDTIAGSDDLVLRLDFHLVASSALGYRSHEAGIEEAREALAIALRIGDRYSEARARHTLAIIRGRST